MKTASSLCCHLVDPGTLHPKLSSLLPTGHALLEEENRVWHLVRPTDEVDEGKSKRGSMKEKERTKAITEIYLTRLLSVKVMTLTHRHTPPHPGACVPGGHTQPLSSTGHTAAVCGQLFPKCAGARECRAARRQVFL